MKSKNIFSISLFIILGMYIVLPGCCKKDDSTPAPIADIPVVQIPAGTFIMGSPTSELNRENDEIQHQVTLSAFRMSKYEITNEQYAAFLNANNIGGNGLWAAGAYPDNQLIVVSVSGVDFGLHYINSQWIPVAGYENYPVINVTWYGATEFATYVGGRLPTEAEWEYACRAATTTPFNTGNCLTDLQANYNWGKAYGTCTNTITIYNNSTQKVGTYPANAFGLYDMHGNVHEWCSDWYGAYSATAQTNPTGPVQGTQRVVRGGSFFYFAQYCRSAFRESYVPFMEAPTYGFRIVLVPKE